MPLILKANNGSKAKDWKIELMRKPYLRLLLLTFLFLFGCNGQSSDSSSIVIEADSSAIGDDGTLVEDVGIETRGGIFTPLLRSGCKIPCSESFVFSTASDNQECIDFYWYRGKISAEPEMYPLGRYRIMGIQPASGGEPNIEVIITASGQDLTLQAIDSATKKIYDIQKVEAEDK